MTIDIDEQGFGATQETVAKLRPDPLRLMLFKGPKRGISIAQWEAALAIRRAFEIITAPTSLVASDYEREIKGKVFWGGWRSIGPLAGLEVVKRYNDWADEMDARKIPIGPVIDLVVGGVSCRQLDRARKVRSGSTSRLLKDALRVYTRLAGWERGP